MVAMVMKQAQPHETGMVAVPCGCTVAVFRNTYQASRRNER